MARSITKKLDSIRVKIEEVNLTARMPVAKGRELQTGGMIDIDISRAAVIPITGELWWIERITGRWRLKSRAADNTTDINTTPGRPEPGDIWMNFLVTEATDALEYKAFVSFASILKDDKGIPSTPDSYVIEWIPCSQDGTIQENEKTRQQAWVPGDAEVDPAGDYDLPAADGRHIVILADTIVNPKTWWWKTRICGVTGGKKGAWSDWSSPALPEAAEMPLPPIPAINLDFEAKECKSKLQYQAVVTFRDVGQWDLPGGDAEDDVQNYEVQLEPMVPIYNIISTDSAITYEKIALPSGVTTAISPGNSYTPDEFDVIYDDKIFRKVDPKKHPIQRLIVEDSDEEDLTWVTLGKLAQCSPMTEEDIYVDETGFTWPGSVDSLASDIHENFTIRIGNVHYTNPDTTPVLDEDGCPVDPYVPPLDLPDPFSEYEDMFVKYRDQDATYIKKDGPSDLGTTVFHYRVGRPYWGPDGQTAGDNHEKNDVVELYYPNHRYRATVKDLQRPKQVWWHARIRTTDRFNKSSRWGRWTKPKLPGVVEDTWLFDPPTAVAVDFDRVGKGANSKWRSVVTWTEAREIEVSDNVDAECYDIDNNVTHYGIQLAPSDGTILVGPVTTGETEQTQTIRLSGVFSSANEIQYLTTPLATEGTFTLTWLGKTTSAIRYDTDQDVLAASIQAELIDRFVELEGIDANHPNISVTVQNYSSGQFQIEWINEWANKNVGILTGNGTNLIMPHTDDSKEISTIVSDNGKYSKFYLTFNDGSSPNGSIDIDSATYSNSKHQITFNLNTLTFAGPPSYKLEVGDVITVDGVRQGSNQQNSKYNGKFKIKDILIPYNSTKKKVIVDAPNNPGAYSGGGKIHLESNIAKTDYIPWDAEAADIQAALEALPYISVGDIEVIENLTKGNNRLFTVTFLKTGRFAGQNIPPLVAYTNENTFTITITQEDFSDPVTMKVLNPNDTAKLQSEIDSGQRYFVHLVAPGEVTGTETVIEGDENGDDVEVEVKVTGPMKYEVFEVTHIDDAEETEKMTITATLPSKPFHLYYKKYVAQQKPSSNPRGQNRNTEVPIVVVKNINSQSALQDALDTIFGENNTSVSEGSSPYVITFTGDLENKDIQKMGKLYVNYLGDDTLTPNYDDTQIPGADAVLYFAGDGSDVESVTKQHGGTSIYTVRRGQKGTRNYGDFFKEEGYIDYKDDTPKDEKFTDLHVFNWPYQFQKISTESDVDDDTRAKVTFTDKIIANYWYQARVRYFDSYGRQSGWSEWKSTRGESPEDQSTIPAPTITEAFKVDDRTLHMAWTGPYDAHDPEMMFPGFDHYRVELLGSQNAREHASTTTYSEGEITRTGGKTYKSRHKNNKGKNPTTDTTWWEETDTNQQASLIKAIDNTRANDVNFTVKDANRKDFIMRVSAVDAGGNRSEWATSTGSSAPQIEITSPTNIRIINKQSNQLVQWSYDDDIKDIDRFDVKLFKEIIADDGTITQTEWTVDGDATWQKFNLITDATWGYEITAFRTNNIVTVTSAYSNFVAGDHITIDDGDFNKHYVVKDPHPATGNFTIEIAAVDWDTFDSLSGDAVCYRTGNPKIIFTYADNTEDDEDGNSQNMPFDAMLVERNIPLSIQVEGVETGYDDSYTMQPGDRFDTDNLWFEVTGPLTKPTSIPNFTSSRVIYYNIDKAFASGHTKTTQISFNNKEKKKTQVIESINKIQWYAIVRAVNKSGVESPWIINKIGSASSLPAVTGLDMIVDQKSIQVKWTEIDDEIYKMPLETVNVDTSGTKTIKFNLKSNWPSETKVINETPEMYIDIIGMENNFFNRHWKVLNASNTGKEVEVLYVASEISDALPVSGEYDSKFEAGLMYISHDVKEEVGYYLVELFKDVRGGNEPLYKAVNQSSWLRYADTNNYYVRFPINEGKLSPEFPFPTGPLDAGYVYTWGAGNKRQASAQIKGNMATFKIPNPGQEKFWACRVRAVDSTGKISKNASAVLAVDSDTLISDLVGDKMLPRPSEWTISNVNLNRHYLTASLDGTSTLTVGDENIPEVQEISFGGSNPITSAGTFKILYDGVNPTDAITYGSTNVIARERIQVALDAKMGANVVVVSGGTSKIFTVTWVAPGNQPQMKIVRLSGNWTVHSGTRSGYDAGVKTITPGSQSSGGGSSGNGKNLTDAVWSIITTEDYPIFTITYDGQTTSDIAWNAYDFEVRDTLLLLSNIIPGQVSVYSEPAKNADETDSTTSNIYYITFQNALGKSPQTITVNDATAAVEVIGGQNFDKYWPYNIKEWWFQGYISTTSGKDNNFPAPDGADFWLATKDMPPGENFKFRTIIAHDESRRGNKNISEFRIQDSTITSVGAETNHILHLRVRVKDATGNFSHWKVCNNNVKLFDGAIGSEVPIPSDYVSYNKVIRIPTITQELPDTTSISVGLTATPSAIR